MKRTLSWLPPVLLLVLGLGCATGPAGGRAGAPVARGGLSVEVDAGEGVARIACQGRPALVYAFAREQHKPYVRELYTLRGENVLRDAPADHLHHHGLMLALRVNGVNFWEERAPAGRQVPEGPPGVSQGTDPAGNPQATLVQWIRWQPPGTEDPSQALLREVREIRLTLKADAGEVVLDWSSEFRPERGAQGLVLHGPDYHGLGLRLPAEFDRVAEFTNGTGLPYSQAQTYDVRPASWTAVAGAIGGREVQVVLASHPSNPGRSSFFTMRNAFAYLAATPETARWPLVLEAGKSVRFRYRLVVLGARRDPRDLEELVAPWLRSP